MGNNRGFWATDASAARLQAIRAEAQLVRRWASVARNVHRTQVLFLLIEEPRLSMSDLARALDLSKQGVSTYVKDLHQAGWTHTERIGRVRYVRLANEQVRACAVSWRECMRSMPASGGATPA